MKSETSKKGPRLHICLSALCLTGLLVSSCTVGPDYHAPTDPAPSAYKELTPDQARVAQVWQPARPNDQILRGKWWELYQEPELNALEEQVNVSNQNILEAEANYRAAQAVLRQNKANYYPTVDLDPGANYAQISKDASTQAPLPSHNLHYDLSAPVEATYLLDLWGSVRRTVESSQATAQATLAQLESARLSYHAQVAQDYFSLRGLDAEKEILRRTVQAYAKDLELTHNLYQSGVDSRLDLFLVQSQLQASKAQLADLDITRGQYEHALATLTGKPASTFSVPVRSLRLFLPEVPVGVPSNLLERRPDIATAERQMAAANAQIGVADAGYYPAFVLSGSGGFEAYQLAELFTWPSLAWSVGASLTQPLFNGGKTHAQVEQARANYDSTLANYRQVVLAALQQVEDSLVALHSLENEATAQDLAVDSAEKSVAILENQYQAGTSSYLNLLTEKITAATDELNAMNILTRRMVASVSLIESLGGSWSPPSVR